MLKQSEPEDNAISEPHSLHGIHNSYILQYILIMYGDYRMPLTINLGAPYEAIIERLIKRGYAGNKTEVLRQALVAYEQKIDAEEETRLVKKKVEKIMAEIESGKRKTYTLEEIEKEFGL
jgi:Arc/MetJ-type ribon-helix-helix transcriptional regulator